jgi:Effector Associated Constant Component 1
MEHTSLRISVNASTTGEANRLTTELEQWLKANVDDLELSRVKDDAESQDAGSVLVAVLAAPAVVAFAQGPVLELAKGLADWLRKRRATVTIGADGSVTTDNVRAEDVERIILGTLQAQQHKG